MRKSWFGTGIVAALPMVAVAALMGVAITAVDASPVTAQDTRVECRCVDADGNEIDNCSCLRRPQFDRLLPQIAMFRDSRPRLGVSVEMINRNDVEGARVADVLEDGPADRAGLREGDVIVAIDGRSLNEPIDADRERRFDMDQSVPGQRLLALARDLEPGQKVEVEYLRDGRRQTTMIEAEDLSSRWGGNVQVLGGDWDPEELTGRLRDLTENAGRWQLRSDGPEIAFRHDDGTRVFGGGDLPFVLGMGRSGLSLAELNPGLGEYFGTTSGVLVLEVENRNLGLEAGDVVLAIGGREVTTPERMRRILGSYAQDEDIEMRVMRDGAEIEVTGRHRY